MLFSRFSACACMLAAVVSGAALAQQNFPIKPIRILTGTAGGSSDIAARLIAQGLTGVVGQQVIVDARPNVLARDVVIKSPPDGYNLLLAANSFYLGPLLRDDALYDPVKDFTPVTLAIRGPNIIVVHPSLPSKTLKELIALAKARPGQLNYASGASGASTHLGPELLKAMAGIDITRVPYKGGAQALADLVGGQVQMMFVNPSPGMPYIKAGRLRALAITSAQPSPLFPSLPTVAAAALPGFEHTAKVGIYGPANMPAAVLQKLNQGLVHVLNGAEIKEKFFELGIETVGSTPEQLAAAMKSEMTRMGKVIKDAGIREE
jgi:tripartite-type tricarboxylate transporter receptor subunit TctC